MTNPLPSEGAGSAAAMFCVQASGIGIRPGDLPHIFERFYRAASQPEAQGSAGLGLAIAKRILELHGSAIEVQSVPGEGTSFTFHLPSTPHRTQNNSSIYFLAYASVTEM